MISSWKHVTQRISPGLSTLLLMMLLAACGGSGSTASSATPTPKPPTPTPTTPAVTMKTYTGTNFSINYPQDWQTHASGNQVTFVNAQETNAMTIVTVPNTIGLSASAVADSTLPIINKILLTNAQPATVPATATVGGETWVERGSTGKLAIIGQGPQAKLIMLFDNHPANGANTKAYEIYYFAPSATFDQIYATDFQAMLQSFKFTA